MQVIWLAFTWIANQPQRFVNSDYCWLWNWSQFVSVFTRLELRSSFWNFSAISAENLSTSSLFQPFLANLSWLMPQHDLCQDSCCNVYTLWYKAVSANSTPVTSTDTMANAMSPQCNLYWNLCTLSKMTSWSQDMPTRKMNFAQDTSFEL